MYHIKNSNWRQHFFAYYLIPHVGKFIFFILIKCFHKMMYFYIFYKEVKKSLYLLLKDFLKSQSTLLPIFIKYLKIKFNINVHVMDDFHTLISTIQKIKIPVPQKHLHVEFQPLVFSITSSTIVSLGFQLYLVGSLPLVFAIHMNIYAKTTVLTVSCSNYSP